MGIVGACGAVYRCLLLWMEEWSMRILPIVNKVWVQELLWVRRNEHGVLVDVSEKLPAQAEFIPTVPVKKGVK